MMKRYKKAQGLSLNMVAVGVISITLLVIIIAIFISSMDEGRKDLEEKTKGVECTGEVDLDDTSGVDHKYAVKSYEECMNAEDGRIALGTFIDPKDGEPLDENVEVCCLFAI